MKVQLELRDILATVQDDLARVDARVRSAAEVEYPLLAAVVNDIIAGGGKRIRPALMLLIAQALGSDPDRVILIGDYLFAQAARTAAETGSTRVMDIFGRILAEITDGQLREVFKAHDPEQTFDDYERRIYGKTASLFAGSAEIAAVLTDADEGGIAAAREYA